MNYVWVDQDSSSNFISVLPEAFADNKDNICICACDDDGNICGALCFSLVVYQIDILWLYTDKKYRRQGIATALMDKIFEIATLSGEIYPISARFEPLADKSLYYFFISYSKMETDFSHERFYVTPKEIRGAKLPELAEKEEYDKKGFFSLPESLQNNVLLTLMEKHGFVVADYMDFKEHAVEDLCRCIMRGDELLDLIFIQKRSDGNLELSFLYSENTKGLMELLTTTAWDIEELFPKAKLVFDAINEEAASMAGKLFPWTAPVPVYEAQW